MKKTALLISLLVLLPITASAGTFEPVTYVAGVDVLNRSVANQHFDRDLFGAPYATVIIGNVDVYDRFPYLEARYFQVVSDPSWNRLLLGEVGQAPAAWAGDETPFGHLAAPRGLSSDEWGRIYVADSGNDRVVVLQATSEFDRMTLEALYTIDGLHDPYDVAYSDGGTPFAAGDDRLFIANTGRNEVRMYTLGNDGASLTDAIGSLGSGAGSFAGPLAITVGRHEGTHTGDVIVSDAHNGRLVHLTSGGDALAWAGEVRNPAGPSTSLDTDHWGNVYATSPQGGHVVKYTSSLIAIADYSDNGAPRGFHVPFANVTDHRTDVTTRRGQGSGVMIEEWSTQNGIRMFHLGVEMTDVNVRDENGTTVQMILTDYADVTLTATDPETERVIARRDAGRLSAGPQTIRLEATDFVSPWEQGTYRMTIQATSTYDEATMSEVAVDFEMNSAGSPVLPDRLTSLGNTPNPFNPTTIIRFSVPAGGDRPYSLHVYDVAGRLVRTLGTGSIGAGTHAVEWNGRSDAGTFVGSGVYLYRIEAGAETLTGKMVLVK